MNKETAIKGFILLSENANDHFDTAKSLAKKGKYGLAVSHLVLSAEESIKAMYFAMQFFDTDIDNITLKELFSAHKAKHRKIQIGNKIIKEIITEFLDEVSKGDKDIKEDFKEIKTSIKASNYKIFNEANNIKNKGFYVDYINNNFFSPNQIKEEEYKTFYQLTWELIIANSIISIKLKNTAANSGLAG